MSELEVESPIRQRTEKVTRRTALILITSLMSITSVGPSLADEAKSVRSLLEIRQNNVVVQEWDLSCGAAALATILNYQHGDPVSEREIAIGMMTREEYLENPMIVNLREGFSLLDLKRFVDTRGYKGVGLGQMTLKNLIADAPMIVPVNLQGYQHFVVFRGVLGNRVLLADPAYGNRTMLRSTFEKAWIEYAELGRVGFVVKRTDNLIPPNRLEPSPDDFVTLH